MIVVFFFFVCFAASTVGALVGAGGGVIIKPVLDMVGVLPVSTVSFFSGCTVLAMSVCSLIRTRKNGVPLRIRISTTLAIGAVFGGLCGQMLFERVKTSFSNEAVLGFAQALCLMLATLAVLIYVLLKKKIRTLEMDHLMVIFLIGLFLGLISAFLGIGGGPLNVVVLFYFFSMDAKEAAKNSIYIILFSQTASLIRALYRGTIPDFEKSYLLAMMMCGVAGALVGAAISKRIRNQGVERAFNLLLLVIIGVCAYNVYRFACRL